MYFKDRHNYINVYKLSLYCYKSNVILTDKSSKDLVFIMECYSCKYIHNVSHNSLIVFMIVAANIEIIRLHLKF